MQGHRCAAVLPTPTVGKSCCSCQFVAQVRFLTTHLVPTHSTLAQRPASPSSTLNPVGIPAVSLSLLVLQLCSLFPSPPLPSTLPPSLFVRDPTLEHGAGGPVGATGPLAAGRRPCWPGGTRAAGPFGWTAASPRPGIRNTNPLCKGPPSLPPPPVQSKATAGWNQGPSLDLLLARGQSAVPGAGFPQAQDKSG
jgi:hypothetical protein